MLYNGMSVDFVCTMSFCQVCHKGNAGDTSISSYFHVFDISCFKWYDKQNHEEDLALTSHY